MIYVVWQSVFVTWLRGYCAMDQKMQSLSCVVWGMDERGVRMAVRRDDRGLARSELVMRVGNYFVATR